MKTNEKSRPISEEAVLSQSSKDGLCGFFKLLLTIDKRNNPGLYGSDKSGHHPNPAEKRPHGICLR